MSPRIETTPAADTPRRAASHPTHVCKLVIEYPPRSLEPGWEPPGWEPDTWDDGPPDSDAYMFCGPYDEYQERYPFRWPQNRLYLSRSGAARRARALRKYGATVEVVQSLPVEWPTPADGAP
jgi:hypothetical protein